MKAICNERDCGLKFEIDTEKGGQIICPAGHVHGLYIGSQTGFITISGCHFVNRLTVLESGACQ